MGTRDPRVDAYLRKSQPFARPILAHVREVVHRACPEVVETIKWGFPFFEYEGPLAGMAAFKAHATFGFWRGSALTGLESRTGTNAMGQFGRLESVADLPSVRELTRLVKQAMKLNASGVKTAHRPRTVGRKPAPVAPPDLVAALRRNARARATWDCFPPGHRREYVEWIVGAKRDETRRRRVGQAVEWMAEGKPHHWRYMAKRAAAR